MYTNLFGTDGIRALFGTEPLSDTTLPQLGNAIAQWIVDTYGRHAHILMISDTRQSCNDVKSLLLSGMLHNFVQVFDAGIVPTPGACIIMKEVQDFQCAIVISASHNSHEYNGIKIIDAQKGKISEQDEHIISTYYHHSHLTTHTHHHGTIKPYTHALEIYRTHILKKFPVPFLNHQKVVIDCAHGAASSIAPSLFTALGAEVITIHNTPNGTNINEACGSTHPEKIQAAVLTHHAYAGFAFDGDADRLIAVNKDGELIDGDDILGLIGQHPTYQTAPDIVGTIVSNEGLAHMLKQHNKNLIRTPVGDKYVARILQEKKLLLGGESSGHIIMMDHCLSSDGIFCALRVLETMALTHNHTMKTFQRFPCARKNIAITTRKKLEEGICAKLIEQANNQLMGGRLVVRYSGTEPILRIHAEAPTDLIATTVVCQLAEKLSHELS